MIFYLQYPVGDDNQPWLTLVLKTAIEGVSIHLEHQHPKRDTLVSEIFFYAFYIRGMNRPQYFKGLKPGALFAIESDWKPQNPRPKILIQRNISIWRGLIYINSIVWDDPKLVSQAFLRAVIWITMQYLLLISYKLK